MSDYDDPPGKIDLTGANFPHLHMGVNCGSKPSPPCGDKRCIWHYGTMPDQPDPFGLGVMRRMDPGVRASITIPSLGFQDMSLGLEVADASFSTLRTGRIIAFDPSTGIARVKFGPSRKAKGWRRHVRRQKAKRR